MKTALTQGALALLLLAGSQLPAHAFTHPCLPLTNADLDALNANKTTAPWSVGYNQFISPNPWPEPHTKLNYVMKGPFVEVGRNPDVNLAAWRDDMKAIFGLALQWKFTGDAAYAEKAKSILLAWANTHTVWSGVEPYLDLGDYMPRFGLGASILRSYSGWTAADTTVVKNYFSNVHWPAATVTIPLRSANQGAAHLVNGMGVAVYCDDTTKFNQVVDAFRKDGCTGLLTTQSNGQVGDTGRDQGHARGELLHYAWMAEVAWKAAGVDLFAEGGNRLRAAGEYYANYNNGGSPAFIKAGTCYDLFSTIGGAREPDVTPDFLHLLQGAYVVRKGQSMPLLAAYLANQTDDWESWIYRKSSDTSTVGPLLPGVVSVGTTAVASGLVKADINTAVAGSASYGGGTWTLAGAGADLWGGAAADGCTFAYKAVTGDCTIIAKVTSVQNTNVNARGGVMIRETLAAGSKMAFIALKPDGTVEGSGRGYNAVSHYANTEANPAALPYWIKLERFGTRVACFHSPDGANWTPIKTFDFTMAGNVYLGLVASSHVTNTLSTSTFTNVSIGSGIPNGTYRVRNRASGKYLDNLGSVTDGAKVYQWTGGGSNNQKWTVTTSAGYSKLACVTGGKFLDSVNESGDNRPCGQWAGGGSPNQQWSIVDLGNGYFKIVNRANGFCLDTGGTTNDGVDPMEFWRSGGSLNQQWQFVP